MKPSAMRRAFHATVFALLTLLATGLLVAAGLEEERAAALPATQTTP
jgi:hypothetical protein